MSNQEQLPHGEGAAYRQGWSAGLALGALAMAVAAFINLLSLEKSLLAIALALVAMRGAGPGRTSRRGRLVLALAALHLTIAAVALALYHDRLARLLSLLHSLG